MEQGSDERPAEPGSDRPRASRLAQGLLIGAIVVLIVIAIVSFN
jgi:hypothetical protein